MPKAPDSQALAQLIHDAAYRRFMRYKKTLFLCGAGNHKEDSVRKALEDHLSKGPFWYRYDIFYPEDLFDELLYGSKHQDLITLENLLADSVDAVVLVIESPGAIAELGAFAANHKLRKKLVVVVNRDRRRDKSFINYGPLRLLRDRQEGRIVFGSFKDVSDQMIREVRHAISQVQRNSPKTATVRSVVHAHHYVLSAIYLTEPVERNTLVDLVFHASKQTKRDAEALTASALSILNKSGEIELKPHGYVLSTNGIESFRKVGRRGTTQYTFDTRAMDRIRVSVLNWKMRGKIPDFAGLA